MNNEIMPQSLIALLYALAVIGILALLFIAWFANKMYQDEKKLQKEEREKEYKAITHVYAFDKKDFKTLEEVYKKI